MRIRTIKPEFFLHDRLFDLESKTKLPLRLSFIGLWCAADRDGRFKWEPRRLGASILPYDKVEFSRVLDALLSDGFVERYGENGEYGCIPNFFKHQCINTREAKSTIPPPDSNRIRNTSEHIGFNITESVRQLVYARDGGKCRRCNSMDDLTVDHIFPRSIGGTHAISNLRTLCRSCNSKRPVAGKELIEDLAIDGLTLEDMQRTCITMSDNGNAHGEGKGKEGKGKEGNGLAPKGACEPSGSRSPVDWNFITEWWNRIADKNRLSKINGMTESRKKKWQTRIAAGMDIAKVEDAIDAASDFIREGWFGFDWFIESENNLAKLVEGKYAAKASQQPRLAIGQRLDADPASESPLERAARRDAENAERITHAGK